MRRLNIYLCRSLAVTFSLTMAITTFVMLLGAFAGEEKLLEVIAKGGAWRPVFLYLACRFPEIMAYTIPLTLLVATVLVFNRMSADNELVALRASGISLLQVVTPLIFFSLLLSVVCGICQFYLVPEYKHRSCSLVREEAVKTPLALLEAGRFIEMFPGYIIYVGERRADRVDDVHICVFRDGHTSQIITASSGRLEVRDGQRQLILHLDDAHIATIDPDAPGDANRIQTRSCEFPLDYGKSLNARGLLRRLGEMSVPQLFARIAFYSELGRPTTSLYMEIHRRAALALAPFSLLLVGVALGIRRTRRETSVGMVACVGVGFAYYCLVSLVETMNHLPHLHPEFLMWLPNVLCQAGGIWGLWQKR